MRSRLAGRQVLNYKFQRLSVRVLATFQAVNTNQAEKSIIGGVSILAEILVGPWMNNVSLCLFSFCNQFHTSYFSYL